MNLNDIIDSRSSEILELFNTIEKINTNINNHMDTNQSKGIESTFLGNMDVCKLLGLSPRTLQDYRDKRLIAFYKLEGKILYKMSDIKKMLEKNYYDAWKKKR